ncbi:hypothetical protein [Pleurocapsa sp. FMAR1]|uniref:hypothetical protein n=1 Tax=Pleurocapsa sp. FMAR1 TaxID=3040204 RepID=UPI0029C7CDCB|nr:hypothetical protein [Pleurocapsa sp. FMAR1]
MSIQNKAEELKLKAEARSEDIEATIREKLGDFSDDRQAVERGQEKQEKADKLSQEAEEKQLNHGYTHYLRKAS